MKLALSPFVDSSIDISSHTRMSNVGYADDVVLLSDEPSKLKVFPDRLNGIVCTFNMDFISSKFKMLLRDWVGSKPKLVRAKEQLGEVDRFTYLGGCISSGCLIGRNVIAYTESSVSTYEIQASVLSG